MLGALLPLLKHLPLLQIAQGIADGNILSKSSGSSGPVSKQLKRRLLTFVILKNILTTLIAASLVGGLSLVLYGLLVLLAQHMNPAAAAVTLGMMVLGMVFGGVYLLLRKLS